ncbi:hypothetical protein C8Q74DRAFT_1300523 [Fomes fomentarius]|nr:hypothetical protein C8Q74DRAFT_1300523 [Fomes fomentarius]
MPPSRSKASRKDPGVDIEALSRGKAKYFIVHAEESHFLASDPTARDKAIAKLYANPNIRNGFPCAETYVGPDDDPDAFLAAVDSVLDKPADTIDQRVFRLHASVSGLLVYNKYKINDPLTSRDELKVNVRSRQIYRDWMSKNLPPPESATPLVSQTSITLPASRVPSSSIKPLHPESIEALLNNHQWLLSMKFVLEADSPERSTWEIESFLTKKGGNVEYNVVFEDDSAAIPHDAKGIRVLLERSHIIV